MRILRRAVAGSLLLSIAAPAAALGKADPAAVSAALSGCDRGCGSDERKLTITDAVHGRRLADVIVGFDRLESATMTDFGRVIAFGWLQDRVPVVDVIDVTSNTVREEFWGFHGGVSPSGQFLAFAPYTHDDFADEMLFVFDTTRTGPGSGRGMEPPASAVPVFPRAVALYGMKATYGLNSTELFSIASTDVAFESESSLMFIAESPHGIMAHEPPGHFQIIRITSDPIHPWRDPVISFGQAFPQDCNSLAVHPPTVAKLLPALERDCGRH